MLKSQKIRVKKGFYRLDPISGIEILDTDSISVFDFWPLWLHYKTPLGSIVCYNFRVLLSTFSDVRRANYFLNLRVGTHAPLFVEKSNCVNEPAWIYYNLSR